ncbi:hypothetical protein PHYSODRAFT_251553 [Phytophthora sojae]|uniref:Uncharacterized protein n=1 Tax=Phytophthora sojae (strain P6497) TaxID=1094619 RepID=G4YML7_PHYSP|nr:hypothetical protein PHYSODRAFT_251553 [Phytophthora sojae]EGZ28892.1 hypothetical protein PHYSODRAFT_251553 [Phytophthora sojae]|eukprot:XP_009516167.1 hypothetical protein PHYSODRAFT_251553 [Phytophthora sojae]
MPENTKESEAGVQTPATPAYAPFNDVEGSPNYSLFVDVYRFRVLFGSLIVGGILVGVMLPFASDGVRVRTFESTDMDAAEQKKMLDRYNSISGANTALLMKPVDVVLSMVISVAFLCLATKFSQLGERRAYLAMAAVAAVGYLMNTGLSSLNVQVISGDIHPRILAADLAEQSSSDDTAQQLSADGFVTTTWSHSFREDTAGNSVLNTIMRKLFVPTENVPTWCNHTDAFVSPFKNIAASYGFPSRSWQQLALSQALTPTASVAMPMNAATSDLPADYELLMNQSIATNLATYALIVSNSFLGWWSSTDEAWSIYAPGYVNRNQSIPLVMADYLNLTASSPDFLRNLHGVIVEYFEKAENASTTDELATMEFSHVDLAETVAFDAFAIEIPTQMIGSNEVAQACDQRSNTSMIIVSVGKRMEGDAFEDDPDGLAARVANARIVYSLTVGRLSWSLEDLSEVYDASCATGSGCSGVRFPLESSDQLLVGVSDIPMDLLSPINLNAIWFDVGSSQWTTLASTVEEARGAALRTDTTPMFIVLPRNFKTINSTLTEFMLGDGMKDCEVLIDNYLNHIEKNHLYIEHTLQPAYTAGLYYIFQNGMVQSPISANSSSSQQNSLQFAGNIQDMYVQVSIPTTNLLLALAGCALIVVCGITVVAIARRGKVIEHGSAATATEALTNSGKFPPLMLRLYLHDGVGGGTGPTLDSLRVEEVVFAHKEDEAQIFAVGQAISVEKSMCKVTLEP